MPDEQKARILVVDDEPQIRRFLRTSLGAHGYHVLEAESGSEALRQASLTKPDAIVLDLGLPDMDGLTVLARLREWTTTPVIVLSVRGDEAVKVAALDNGADDYVTKPFGMAELLARIRTALRHGLSQEVEDPVFSFDGLVADLARRTITRDGRSISLSPREYDLFRLMLVNAGKVLTHQYLLKTLWGAAHLHDVQYLRVYVSQLRNKLEPEPEQPRYILTEPGVGYRLRLPE